MKRLLVALVVLMLLLGTGPSVVQIAGYEVPPDGDADSLPPDGHDSDEDDPGQPDAALGLSLGLPGLG